MKSNNTKIKEKKESERSLFPGKFDKQEKKKLVLYSEILKAKYKDV